MVHSEEAREEIVVRHFAHAETAKYTPIQIKSVVIHRKIEEARREVCFRYEGSTRLVTE